jgi:hypothetical protein
MSTPEPDLRLATSVARIREAHLHWRSRLARAVGSWFFAGVIVGLTTWFLQRPIDRDAIMAGGVLSLGLAVFFFGGLLTRMLFPSPSARCPRCGCDWNAESSSDAPTWLAWEHCPGCGLRLSGDVASHQKP